MTTELADLIERVEHRLKLAERHGPLVEGREVYIRALDLPAILSALRDREVMRASLLRLANAADCYGVEHLDTDDLDEYAEELQAATLAARALLADQPHPTATPKSAVGEQGWQGIETAPNNRPFWARKSNNEIALCWRHNPSSRTDEVVTWKGNQGFKAVEWRAPDPLPPLPSPDPKQTL
jgi:hypothetical protein